MKTRMLVLAAIFAALVAVCSQIQIPLAPVPINLATFAIFMTAGLLGYKYATLSLAVYVLLGAIGAPVFAGFSGGFGTITGPTGGYIVGYILAAFVTGLIIEKSPSSAQRPSFAVLVISMLAGLLVCYVLGTIWFIHITGWSIGKALMSCVVVFLPGDALKIAVATILLRRLIPATAHYRILD